MTKVCDECCEYSSDCMCDLLEEALNALKDFAESTEMVVKFSSCPKKPISEQPRIENELDRPQNSPS